MIPGQNYKMYDIILFFYSVNIPSREIYRKYQLIDFLITSIFKQQNLTSTVIVP